jgi:uncharacterized protein
MAAPRAEPAERSVNLVVKDGEVRFEVHAKPRAKRSAIVGARELGLEVALAAPPVDGAANAELVAVLARAFGVSKSSVRIVRGGGGRNKLVAVAGISEIEVRERIAVAIADASPKGG